MLDRIETFYLSFLRVVALITATIALAVFIWACSQALPGVIAQFGPHSQADRSGESLASYIAEQQPSAQTTQTDFSSANTTPAIPAKIQQAAALLTKYVQARGIGADTSQLPQVLMAKREQVPQEDRAAYDDSLLTLMQDLNESKGQPLTVDRINELLNWHVEKFSQDRETQKQEKADKAAKASASLAVGGAALVAFLLIIFFFIFVKIERNLRLVRTLETNKLAA